MKVVVGSLVVAFFVVVLALAYTGNGHVYSGLVEAVPGGDKTGHVVLLFLLSFVLAWVTGFRAFRLGGLKVYWGVFAVFVFFTGEEFMQVFSVNRTFDLWDLSCNYVGIALATVCAWRYERVFRSGKSVERA